MPEQPVCVRHILRNIYAKHTLNIVPADCGQTHRCRGNAELSYDQRAVGHHRVRSSISFSTTNDFFLQLFFCCFHYHSPLFSTTRSVAETATVCLCFFCRNVNLDIFFCQYYVDSLTSKLSLPGCFIVLFLYCVLRVFIV